MQRGVCLAVLVVLAAAFAAATAHASGTGTTTGTTTTTASPSYAPLAASSLPATCVGAGAAAIVEPGRTTLAVGTPASALGPSAYPQAKPVVAFDSAAASGSTCRDGSVTLTNVSLFGGTVTAASVQATDGRGTVSGLDVAGSPVTTTVGQSVQVGSWGRLFVGLQLGRLSAPLALQLLKKHGSLEAGDTIFVAFAAAPRPAATPKTAGHASTTQSTGQGTQHTHSAKKHRRKKHAPEPLKWTPRLGFKTGYVFPVDGGASYIDTYGANRSDIYDGWHHGDDLFAPLGTPVLAVRRGTLSLVGWNKIGGWRLWLTDRKGNSFYYAHLAGYARWILHHRHVRAGQVIGFLGRTGDAFTTTPHLHFEIHPHQLLKLGYDGAVDPTTYLQSWRVVRVPASEIPRPARLRAPVGAPAQEASVVWNQLLAARHLLPRATPMRVPFVHLRRPFPPASVEPPASTRRIAALRVAAQIAAPESEGPWPFVALAVGLAASALGAFAVRRRRARPSRP
jgi:murein DD-endopeptidase MepM/ murein hydrolase activator NlpD